MKNTFTTEIVSREHISAIANIESQCFAEPWSESALELFLRDGAFAVVGKSGGEVNSYCTLTAVLDEAQIINVATREEHRGKGYARAVIERVIEECKKRGIASLSLEVRRSNFAAIGLYNSLGFCICGERRGFYRSPKEDALVMIKQI